MFFISIANMFVEGGLSGALIRKKDVTPDDYSTVFIFNLALSLILFTAISLLAGHISRFYHDDSLQLLLIAASLILLIHSFSIIQNARIIKDLKFKQKSLYRIISVFFGAIVGILLAYFDFGVWSLVCMQITIALINGILLWIREGSFFSLNFNKHSFKDLYQFGINTTIYSISRTFFENIYQMILGKYFSLTQAGLYYQSNKLLSIPGNIIDIISQNVIFAHISKLQDNKAEFIVLHNKIALFLFVLMGFISGIIYIYAEQFVLLILGIKWIESIFYMKILTIIFFIYYQEQINLIIYKTFNKTNIMLFTEVVKRILQIFSIIFSIIYLNILFLFISNIIINIISYSFNFYFSRKVLNDASLYTFKKMLTTIAVILISVCPVLYINQFINYSIYFQFITLPLFTLIYFRLLNILDVFDLRKEILDARSIFFQQ